MATTQRGRSSGGNRGRRPGGVKGLVGPHMGDAYGMGLAILAFITLLGVWFGSGGPLGRLLEVAFRGLFGVGGLLAPILLAYLAYVMFVTRPGPDRPRLVFGVGLCFGGFLGIWHLIQGTPDVTAGGEAIRSAGGILGAILAGPLSKLLHPIGAAFVLLGVFILGLLVTTKTPAHLAIERAGVLGRSLLAFIGSAARNGVSVAGRAAEATGRAATAAAEKAKALRNDGLDEDEEEDFEDEPIEDLDEDDAQYEDDDEYLSEDEDLSAAATPASTPAKPTGSADTIRIERRTAPAPEVPYALPSLDLLKKGIHREGSPRTIRATRERMEEVFQNFGVDAEVTGYTKGPTVTRYEVELGAGTPVKDVMRRHQDLGYALGTPEIRMLAPIPGKSAIGIEVPNAEREVVTLGDILRSEPGQKNLHPMIIGLGRDVGGSCEMLDLRSMPHLLIAGQTGAGKSTAVNGIIASILLRATPRQVRMVLIDPKRVELMAYNQVPHLLAPVITTPKRAASALAWVVQEMENRYADLEANGARNIEGFNELVRAGKARIQSVPLDNELPYIVVVVDELADLMMVAQRDVEDSICRIAQKARAVGIHLVVATQRPSREIVTGVIKANIPSRIAFTVASQVDSRVILDQNGAETLVGRGDMLYLPSGLGKPLRIQGAMITETEIEALVRAAKMQADPDFIDELAEVASGAREIDLTPVHDEGNPMGGSGNSDDDDLINKAAHLVVSTGLGSTSMLQRKLGMGFAKAGRVMDVLEQRGIVGPSIGPKARNVLVTPEEWEERSGSVVS